MPSGREASPLTTCHGRPCAGHPLRLAAATDGRDKPGHDGGYDRSEPAWQHHDRIFHPSGVLHQLSLTVLADAEAIGFVA